MNVEKIIKYIFKAMNNNLNFLSLQSCFWTKAFWVLCQRLKSGQEMGFGQEMDSELKTELVQTL